jgi:hypothetical protein
MWQKVDFQLQYDDHPCLRLESNCATWAPVLRMRPYKTWSCVAVRAARKRTLTAKRVKDRCARHRSKFAALIPVMVRAAGYLKHYLGGYKQNRQTKR